MSIIESATQEDSVGQSIKDMRTKDQCYILRKQIEFITSDIITRANNQLILMKPYLKFVGYKFDDMIFDLRSLIFQNQMDQKMQNEEDDFNAMLNFENPDTMQDDYLIMMINKTEITDLSYEFQYNELQDAFWNV